MKVQKDTLCQYLDKETEVLIFDKKKSKELCDYTNEKYQIPTGIIMDMVAKRVGLISESNFFLFILCDGIDKVNQTDKLHAYFNDNEIEEWGSSKYYQEKIEFPIKIKCFQVTDDQWIGASDSNFLMKLRNGQMINYNVNAQRVMKKVVHDGNTAYELDIHKRSVTEIADSMLAGEFIPNTITLNMPINGNTNYEYNTKANELIIYDVPYLDIADGYHRYLAMCLNKDRKPDFNYPIELRIVLFQDSKAQHFISQESKGNKMKKIDIQSMDDNRIANLITDRLNGSADFDMRNQIKRSDGLISFSYFAEAIDGIFIRNHKIDNQNVFLIKITEKIKKAFNEVLEAKTDLITHEFSNREIVILLVGIADDKDTATIIKALEEQDKLSDVKFYNGNPVRKGLITEVRKFIESV